MDQIKTISLGGSLIAPGQVDTDFISRFKDLINHYLAQDDRRKLIFVCGGGAPARLYQQAYREIVPAAGRESQDWIGIAATRLNAELMRHVFGQHCPAPVVRDPTAVSDFPGRVLIAGGWKPGFSTDYDAVLLAEKFKGDTLINLSNIKKVHTDDPRTNPDARPIDAIDWKGFLKITGEEWVPGKNVPFDPVAARHAARIKLKVIVAEGRDLANLVRILHNEPCEGTVIGPD